MSDESIEDRKELRAPSQSQNFKKTALEENVRDEYDPLEPNALRLISTR